MKIRYALIHTPDYAGTVHRVDGDELHVSLCGREVSREFRYSRRDVKALQGRADCKACLRVYARRYAEAR